MRPKITIVGAGSVGGTTAQRIAEKDIGDVVVVDIIEGIARAKTLDIQEAGPIYRYTTRLSGMSTFEGIEDSQVVIVTAGVPRKPGMTREQLLEVNVRIVGNVVEEVVKRAPNAILLMVTNPLDATTYLAYKVSRFPRHRVLGMAGVLDSARFSAFVAMELGISVENVQAMVIGGHGDTMVPLPRFTTVAGIPVSELIPKNKLDAIIDRTRRGGAEIIELLKTASTFFAPSASVVEMVEAMIRDKKKILPSTVYCQGEYGIKDICIGLPAKLGAGGVEDIIEVALTEEEDRALKGSAQVVRTMCAEVDKLILGAKR